MLTLRKPENLWPALWAGITLAFVLVIVLEFVFGRVEVGEGPRAPAKLVEAKLLPAFSMPAEAQVAPETVARPLFAPGRRLAPPATASTTPAMRKGQFVLTGITVAPDVAFAFLKEVATGKTQSLKRGAQVNGIAVDTIEARRVVLKQGDETEELPLNIQVPARVATASAPAGTVPPAPGVAPAPGAAPAAPRPPGTVPPGPTPPSSVPTGMVPPGSVAPAGMPAAAAGAAQPAMPEVPAPAPGRRRPWITAQ